MNVELQRTILSTLAFTLGYLGFWFVYGIEITSLSLLILIGATTAAFAQKRLLGVLKFFALLLSMFVLGGFLFCLFALPFALANGETIFFVPYLVIPIFLVLVIGFALSKHLPKWGRFAIASPFAPWLFVIGVLIFGLFPIQRTDCRQLQHNDSFMKYSSGFTGAGGTSKYWERKPKFIPDLAELPSGFKPDVVRAVATSCNYDQNFQPRVFSFRASRPLIVVYMMVLKNNRVKQSFGALFTPIKHKKLSPWLIVNAPYPYGASTPPREYDTYPFLGSAIYPYSPLAPDALIKAVKN
jgi:hypothetical protein